MAASIGSSGYGGPVQSAGQYHHRSSFNAAHKPFKGRSKGQHRRKFGAGRSAEQAKRSASAGAEDGTTRKIASVPIESATSKQARSNARRQAQKIHRQQVIAQKRSIGVALPRANHILNSASNDSTVPMDSSSHVQEVSSFSDAEHAKTNIGRLPRRAPPKIVTLIPFSPESDCCFLLLRKIESACNAFCQISHNIYQASLKHGSKNYVYQFYVASRHTYSVLDAAKVSDILLPVFNATSDGTDLSIDSMTSHLLTVIKAQGPPTIMTLLHNIDSLSPKKQSNLKTIMKRYTRTAFDEETRILYGDTTSELSQLFRWLGEIKLRSIHWREHRCYMLGQKCEISLDSAGASQVTLQVSGYLRGANGLSANQLIHITGAGDFQLSKITCSHSVFQHKNSDLSMNIAENEHVLLDVASADLRESLDDLIPIDLNNREQSIITDEEMNQELQQESSMISEEIMNSEYDSKYLQLAQNCRNSALTSCEDAISENDDVSYYSSEGDEANTYWPAQSVDDDISMNMTSEEKKKLERDEADYPDEVSYSEDTICRQRFAHYRGLKSLKDSFWDNKESLPLEYSQIYQFANFNSSKKHVMELLKDGSNAPVGVPANNGSLTTVHILNVPIETAERLISGKLPVVIFGLFKYEHKVSVSHYKLKRHAEEYTEPIKAKEPLEMQCAFRRWIARPIYSHESSIDKHLTQRYFQMGPFTIATVYSRILFPPATVIAFKPQPNDNTPGPLIASGSLLSVNADRMLIKRVVLTGNVISSHKRLGIVRYMFYNAEDVRWFKPVRLWTKFGLVGHIKEPRGTKGHMKCIFDDHIKQHDTVCMSLYKRQFPKWDPSAF